MPGGDLKDWSLTGSGAGWVEWGNCDPWGGDKRSADKRCAAVGKSSPLFSTRTRSRRSKLIYDA